MIWLLLLLVCSVFALEPFAGNVQIVNVGVKNTLFWPSVVNLRFSDALIFTAESGIHQIIQTDNASCDAIASSPEPLARPGTPSTQETWSTKFDTIGTFYFSSKQSCQPGGSVLTVTVTNSSTISIQPQFDPVTPVQPMQLPDSGTPVTSVPPIQSTYIPPPNAVGLNPGLANGGLNGAPKPNSASSVRIGLVTIILSLLLL